MRFIVITALSALSAPALACGMYMPEHPRVAIAELMEIVDGPEAEVDAPEAAIPVVVLAGMEASAARFDEIFADEHATPVMPADVQATAAVVVPAVVSEIRLQPLVAAPTPKLTRKQRRALKRQAATTGV